MGVEQSQGVDVFQAVKSSETQHPPLGQSQCGGICPADISKSPDRVAGLVVGPMVVLVGRWGEREKSFNFPLFPLMSTGGGSRGM